jgi:hypothetical protein
VRVVHRSDFITEEYEIHSREAAGYVAELILSLFGQSIPPNTSQYGPFLTTAADPDEVLITSPVSQQEDLYGLSPPCSATQNAIASDARLSSPATDMADSVTGGSSSNIYHPSRLDQLNGDSLSRPNSFANVRVLLLAKSCLFTFDPMLTQSSMHKSLIYCRQPLHLRSLHTKRISRCSLVNSFHFPHYHQNFDSLLERQY